MELTENTGDKLLTENGMCQNEPVERPKRQTWSSQLDFIMTGIGGAVGLGNLWRFPFLCYKNGGGAFLIPYLVSFFLMSAPVFILEIGLGQYTSGSCVGCWNMLPAFKGVGVCAAIVLWYIGIYYIIVISWGLYYLYSSLRAEVPWASCDNPWNTDSCFVTGMTVNTTIRNCTLLNTGNMSGVNCSTGHAEQLPVIDAVVEFWENHVLQRSPSIGDPGSLVPGLVVSLFIAWLLIFFCLFKGISWTGKLVYVTATVPYILLTVLLIRGVMLDGARDGIIYYLKPDFSRLADGQVWIDATTQVLFSTGVGHGFLISLGSYNKFHANPIRNGLIVTSVNCLTSLFGGFCVFAVLGFMAKETNQTVDDVVSSGPGLVFLAYPKAMTQLPLTSLWSALFFAMLIFLGLDSQFAGVEGLITVFMDIFPKTLYNARNRGLLLAAHCTLSFLIGLAMVTEGGVYVFRLFDHYAVSGIVLLVVTLFEASVVGWVFGADKFNEALELMVGYKTGRWIKWSWQFFTPAATLAVIIFQIATFESVKYDDSYSFPSWTNFVGLVLMISSLIWIPAVFIHRLMTSTGSLAQRWRRICIPSLRQHQVHPNWHHGDFKWRQID